MSTQISSVTIDRDKQRHQRQGDIDPATQRDEKDHRDRQHGENAGLKKSLHHRVGRFDDENRLAGGIGFDSPDRADEMLQYFVVVTVSPWARPRF